MSRASSKKSQLVPSSPISQLSLPIQSFMESQMAQIIDQADPIITQWDVDTASVFAKVTSLFHENHRGEANNFINHVNQLHETMRTLLSENSSSKMLVPAQVLFQNAMKRLRKEFCQLLSINRAYLDPESISIRSSAFSTCSSHSSKMTSTNSDSSSTTDHDDSGDEIRVAGKAITEVKNASMVAMADLKLIAECMISTGYGKECVEMYKDIRRSIVDEGLYKLGIEKVSSSKIHKLDWEVLDLKIKNWLKAVNTAVNTLFKGEKILCDQVFAASDTVRELCFNEITKEGATILFNFPERVVKNNKRSPEKIFRLLDMYTAIASNWPEIESIFSSNFLSESSSTIIDLVLNSTIKLRNSVLSALTEFESSIQKESTSKTPAADAGVHRLTTEVMNYLSLLGDYNVLEDMLLDSQPPVKSKSLPDSSFDASNNDEAPAASRRIAWLIFELLCKLDAIARHYKDISHTYLFLANNLRHIIYQVRTSNLRYFLGDDWIIKHEAKVDRFAASYERLGWSHVIDSIPAVNLSSPEGVEEGFSRFNAAFMEAHGKQSVCVVQDGKLREEIKLSIAKKMLPLYREFYDAHGRMGMRRERDFEHVVRFTPEDLRHALSDLFLGSVESRSMSFSSSRS